MFSVAVRLLYDTINTNVTVVIYYQSFFYAKYFLCLRKREEEKKREVLTNPVKMKKIKEMVRKKRKWSHSVTCGSVVTCRSKW